MNYKKLALFLVCLHTFITAKPQGRIFTISQVLDSTYGVEYFERFNPLMGNDSIRKHEGYAVKGLITDKYANGQILHKGYYIDGQLRNYTNYYPDGKIEREFKPLNDIDYQLIKYYTNKQIKSKIIIRRNQFLSWTDYYENGNLELEDIFIPGTDIYQSKKTGYENGNLESELLLINKKKFLYYEKNYYPNQQLESKGEKRYDKNLSGYLKQGKWEFYKEDGTLDKTENYLNDQPIEP